MSDVQLALGPIIFRDFELPNSIEFGGRQRLVIHPLAGGRRVIESLGKDDGDIRFRGILSGPEASLRARILDQLRTAGGFLPLTWDVFYYTVTIRKFVAQYQNDTWIPYKLACTVMRDEADGLPGPIATAGELVLQDITMAAGFGQAGGADLSNVCAVARAPGVSEYGTGAYYATLQCIQQAQAMLSNSITSAEGLLAQSHVEVTTAAGALTSLNSGASAAYELAALVATRSFLGCARADLQ